MFTNLEERKIDLKFKEDYLYNGALRYPSIGMFVCPPDIPSEVFGTQLCFSLTNDINFTKCWGKPGMKLKSMIIDYTNSDYNLVKIREALTEYYKESEILDDGKIVIPEIYNVFDSESRPRHDNEEIQNLVENISRCIKKDEIRAIFIHGISGYYDEAFYDCMAKLKRLTVEHGACIIITHVVASVVYKDGENAMREPLSHKMIKASHLEASALMDWTWIVAPTSQNIIRSMERSRVGNIPNGVNLYANKLIQPNRFISLSNLKFSSQMQNSQSQQKQNWENIFYLYKGAAPVLFDVELTGETGTMGAM